MINFLNKNIFFFSILTALIPFFLITGPFLPDLILSLLSLFFLILILVEKKFYFFKEKLFYYFIFFYSLTIVSAILSPNFKSIIISTILYIRFGVFVLFVKFLIKNDQKFIEYSKNILLLCFFILLVDSTIQFLFGKNIFFLEPPFSRVTSFFGTKSVLGSYISRLCPLLIFLILVSKKKNYTFLKEIILYVTIFLCLISGERASFIFSIVIFFSYLFISKIKIKIIFLNILIFLLIFLLAISFNKVLKARVIDQFFNQVSITSKETTISFPTKKELEEKKQTTRNMYIPKEKYFIPIKYYLMYKSAANIFLDNIFFGSGPRTFRIECYKEKYFHTDSYVINNNPLLKEKGLSDIDSCSTSPHNLYLQLLSETGVISFFFVLFIFLNSFYNVFFNKIKYEKKILLIPLLIFFNPIVPIGNIFGNYINIIFFFSISYLTYYEK